MCHLGALRLWRSDEGIRFLRTKLHTVERQYVVWELNLDPLWEQHVLFTMGSPLQPHITFFWLWPKTWQVVLLQRKALFWLVVWSSVCHGGEGVVTALSYDDRDVRMLVHICATQVVGNWKRVLVFKTPGSFPSDSVPLVRFHSLNTWAWGDTFHILLTIAGQHSNCRAEGLERSPRPTFSACGWATFSEKWVVYQINPNQGKDPTVPCSRVLSLSLSLLSSWYELWHLVTINSL